MELKEKIEKLKSVGGKMEEAIGILLDDAFDLCDGILCGDCPIGVYCDAYYKYDFRGVDKKFFEEC